MAAGRTPGEGQTLTEDIRDPNTQRLAPNVLTDPDTDIDIFPGTPGPNGEDEDAPRKIPGMPDLSNINKTSRNNKKKRWGVYTGTNLRRSVTAPFGESNKSSELMKDLSLLEKFYEEGTALIEKIDSLAEDALTESKEQEDC